LNVGILLDVLHFMRSDGTLHEIRRIPPEWLTFLQICDGPAAKPPLEHLAEEARGARLFPGEGAFPIREILAELPRDLPIEIEVPHPAARGQPLAEQAAVAVRRVRCFLAELAGVKA
jgi:sugar phosphate isomerase/epimerase